jgi:formylglycine-generating enzyme required for sulfatase activity
MKRTSFVLASITYASLASAQTLLTPGATVRDTLSESSPVYPGTQNRYACYALDASPGSHWEISILTQSASHLQIGRGVDCGDARAAGFFHGVRSKEKSGWIKPMWQSNYSAKLRIAASGGRYMLSVADYYYEEFSITAVQTEAAPEDLVVPRGWRRLDPPAGSASTVGAASAQTPGRTFRDCARCPEMIVLPGGEFMMGSPESEQGRQNDEGPRHRVTIARPFAMSRLEVTFDEYDACVDDGACDPIQDDLSWGRERRPAINVSYLNAQHYAGWLSEKTGERYFLPSEAEWEYAARAGTTTPWNTGSAIITDDANFANTFGKTVPAGSYPPNAFGLHDMHGNVSEWTQDCIDAGYLAVPFDGSAATSGDCAKQRVARGGSYEGAHVELRSARRLGVQSARAYKDVGIRLVRAL